MVGKNYIENPLYYNQKKAKKHENRFLTAGEVGCALSHNTIYKLIVEKNLPYALILEDDIIISKDIIKILPILTNYLKDSTIITLERCDVYKKKTKKHLFKNYYLVDPLLIKEGAIAQAAGYLITNAAAKKIHELNLPVYFPADNWGYYKKYVRFFGIIPSQTLIKQDTTFFSTTLQSRQKRQFSKNSIFTYIMHGFFTYNFLGKFIYRILKPLYNWIKNKL